MSEKKLSEELRHCLKSDDCYGCKHCDVETIVTYTRLLQKAYEVVKRYEGMYEIMRPLAERLNEYTVLEEQGKLLKLPCMVGDTVHIIDDSENEFERTSIVTGIEIEEENEVYIMVSDGFQSGSSSSFGVDDFGKTIFLTRPEAERALAEMEGKN